MPTIVKTAPSQTGAALGSSLANGKAGDYLDYVLIVPASVSPGAVSVSSNTAGTLTLFAGGTNSVSNLVPFPVPVQQYTLEGGWAITTGAAVSTISFGNFS